MKRDDRIVVVLENGERRTVRAPIVFEYRAYPESVELGDQNYEYVGTQDGTPVYQER